MLVVLIGGARSGKSDLAVRIALARPEPVVIIATAEPGDADMAARIARHRAERTPGWETIEAPLQIAEAIGGAPEGSCVILDCLTLWTANMLSAHGARETEAQAAVAARAAAARPGLTIAVSNEVGLGIHPETPLGRSYRDLHGRVNTIWAGAADRAYFLAAGRVIALQSADALLEELTWSC